MKEKRDYKEPLPDLVDYYMLAADTKTKRSDTCVNKGNRLGLKQLATRSIKFCWK